MGIPTDSYAVLKRWLWQDILDFKADMRDKQWGFRRWLSWLSKKSLIHGEGKDELEWTLNEYQNAMKLHRSKTTNSFLQVFVVAPLELIEDLAKLNISKLVRGVLAIQKRDVELMEAEMRAPGRECAYLFDVSNKFGDWEEE